MLSVLALNVSAEDLNASFLSEKSSVPYYEQGFDTTDSFSTWSLQSSNYYYTWYISEGLSGGISFKSIDPASENSLAIDYAYGQDLDETITSPEITIRNNSTVEFYNYFSPVWLYEASWTFYATDVATGDTVQFLNQFRWANTVGYDETKWTKFSFDLDRIEGKTVTFSFRYQGNGGTDQLIDGFKVVELSDAADSKIELFEGESVQFIDNSTGNVTSWNWEFEGGTPSTSTEQNPTVRYDKAGTYNVKLTVSDGTSTTSATREGYVEVKQQQPNALIGMPEEGYLSPFAAVFIPTNVPVQFRDLSTGNPTSWLWTFKGVDPETTTEQNPTVTYKEKGIYSLSLEATNEAGTDSDAMLYAVQAGGAQYIWNLEIGESENLEKVALGWYGNYAGTNWLGITAFAEKFKKPLATAEIDSVNIYFISNTTVTPDATITVSIRNADATTGAPGEVLASGSFKAGDIAYSDDTFLATSVKLNTTAQVNDEFFVVIEGMPNNTDEETYASDDLAIACVRRDVGQKTTTWQLVEDQDSYGNPLGTSQWFENVDDPVSMAVCPVITYDKEDIPTSISNATNNAVKSAQDDNIYTIEGVRVQNPTKPGIYIKNGKKFIVR